MPDRERTFPGRNPEIGFLNCGSGSLSVNISTHTGFGTDVDLSVLRRALDELSRRAPLLVSRLRRFRHRLPGRHHEWVAPPVGEREPVPLESIDLPAGAGPEATTAHCARGANLAIDPVREPSLRVQLLRRADGTCDLVTVLHHALYDGASVGFVFYALKTLYVSGRSGRDLSAVELPAITTPGDTEFAMEQLGGPSGGRLRLIGPTLEGWRLLLEESRFRDVEIPAREAAEGARSLHRTAFLELDDPALDGLGALLAGRDATLNELLQAVSARAFFDWGRSRGWLDRTLPLATTFNLRRPTLTQYPLGNLETATCVELQREHLENPSRFLDSLVRRSAGQKSSTLPLGHYLALAMLTTAPTSRIPDLIRKIANRAVLLFSYLGSDFTHRYMGHYGAGEDAEALASLVRGSPGSGAGYVTSAPPMGMVITVKRVGRRVALNLSIHDRLTDEDGLAVFARELRQQLELYALLGRKEVLRPAAAAARR